MGLVIRIMVPIAAFLAASLIPSSAAFARVADDPAVNRLYTAGLIARTTCAEKPISKRNNFPIAKAYVTSVVGCLNNAWSKHLAKTGHKFAKPKVTLLSKNPARFCGSKWEKETIYDYCFLNRTIAIVLDRRLLNLEPNDLYIFLTTAELYGEHVQTLTGLDADWAETSPNPDEDEEGFAESVRRLHLQAACLGAAFTASVYKTMPRKTAEWKSIVREKSKEIGYTYGSAKAITYWLNRGFNSRNPKYCNTWTASTAQVS